MARWSYGAPILVGEITWIKDIVFPNMPPETESGILL